MRKILLFSIVFFSVFTNRLTAQWMQVGYLVSGVDTATNAHMIKGFGAQVFCASNKGLYRSNDNGTTWFDLTYNKAVTLNQDIFCVLVANNTNIFAGSNKRMFKSADAGLSWTWLNSLPDSATFYDIVEIGSNIVVAYAKGNTYGVYYSSNSGVSWTNATGITSNVRYFFIDGTTLFLGGTTNGVYKSTDNGQTWTVSGTGFPASPGIWGVLRSGNNLFAHSVSGSGLFQSTDNGLTWTSSSPTVFNGFCQVFSFASHISMIVVSNDGACNPNAASSVRISYDYGNTWNNFLTGTAPPNVFPCVGTNSPGTSFFLKRGNGKHMYRYDVPSSVAKNYISGEQVSVFPNPTNGNVQIKIDHLDGAMPIVDLYSATGQKILSKPVSHQGAEINLGGITKGIYLLKITGDANVLTKTIVVQ